MLEYLKDPTVIQIIISSANIIAAIIVIIAAFMIRKNRSHIEKTTKLLGDASIHLENTFDSMLKTMTGISELRKMYPREGDIHLKIGERQKVDRKPNLPEAVAAGINPQNKTIDLTDEVIELKDEVPTPKGKNK